MLAGKDHSAEEIGKVMRVFVPKVVEHMELATAAAKMTGRVRFGLLSLGGLLMCVSLLRDNAYIAVSNDASNVMFWLSIIAILLNTWLGHMATSMQLAEKATLYMASLAVLKVMGTCYANRTAMYSYEKFPSSSAAATQFWQDFAALELEVGGEEVKILSGKGQIDGQHARLVAAMNEPSLLMRNQRGGVIVEPRRPPADASPSSTQLPMHQPFSRAPDPTAVAIDMRTLRPSSRASDTQRRKRARAQSPSSKDPPLSALTGAAALAASAATRALIPHAALGSDDSGDSGDMIAPLSSAVGAARSVFDAAVLDVEGKAARTAGRAIAGVITDAANVAASVVRATTDEPRRDVAL